MQNVDTGSRRGRRTIALILAGSFALGGCASSGASPLETTAAAPALPPQPSAPAASVSYTLMQADQGRQVFNTICSACHAPGEFRGQIFRQTWMARPLGDFFQHISTAMPQDNPGSLTPAQYIAVVAYVLQMNGHPPGERELPADASALAGMAWPR